MTFAKDIEDVASPEQIEAVVIGPFGWSYELDEPELAYGEDRIERPVPVTRGVLLHWEYARPMLDYNYDRGLGSPSCDAIWAWTKTKVIFVSTYDGSTRINFVPRNPTSGKPEMPGGG